MLGALQLPFHICDHESHLLWQAQYLVKFMCHFSWQVQHFVKCGMIAGARNFAFSIQNARGEREKSPRWRGGLRTDGFMVRSWSDHSRIGRALFLTFHLFWRNVTFGESFCVACKIFGDVGG